MTDLDQKKIDKMWKQILDYEKSEGQTASKKASVSKLVEIISEVYDECY